MLYDLLIIAVCTLWCLICVGICLYLHLDTLRSRALRIWARNRKALAAWYGLRFSSRKPEQQIAEVSAARRAAACGDPDWWDAFASCYNESAQRYAQRLRAPVFRWLGTLFRFRPLPTL